MTNKRIGGLMLAAWMGCVAFLPSASASSDETKKTTLFDIFTRVVTPKKEAASPGLQISPDLLKAVVIAEQRARRSSTHRCWRYVKQALVDADVVESYPGTRLAKEAATELTRNHAFIELASIKCPEMAPVGSVLVYGGRGAGHVEFRTSNGFVSDFVSERPSSRPLIGVFVKPPGESKKDTEKAADVSAN